MNKPIPHDETEQKSAEIVTTLISMMASQGDKDAQTAMDEVHLMVDEGWDALSPKTQEALKKAMTKLRTNDLEHLSGLQPRQEDEEEI